MVIIGIYRPPKALCGDYQTSLESELSYVCNWASLKSNSVVVLGDLNPDRLRPDKREGKLLLDLETEQGLTCLITQPTRTEKRGTMITSTLIDVLLTNRPELFKRSGNYYPALSDHAMIFGILRDRVKPTKPKVISFRSYRNFNLEDFNKDLSMVPWQVGEIFDEADDQLFFWDTMAREIIDKHVPVKTMRVRNHDAPYMNKQWKSAIRTKRKAEAKYRKNRTDENWEYKRKCRNEATRQRRLAIKQYWKTKADDLGKNPKDFFRTFKPFISDKGNRADADITINHGEAIVKDQSKVSEIFADYFATIADHIKSVDADLTDLKDFTNHPSVQAIKNKMEDTSETFEFQPVNRMQVKTALESLDTNKATGHDGIPAKILKAGAQELSLPLTTLFNSCIRKAQWPSDWKKGDWIPVFKKEDKQAKENYRPVTVLTCASKVLERLLSNQFTSSFDRRLGDCLTAYRKHNSCETTIVSLVEDWKQVRDKHLSVAILSTDMSKAFDCLHPPLLLSKLKAYGVQEKSLNLLRSYLCNRKGRVRIGNVSSSWRNVSRGCPQGSVLGPLLWNMFQNDLSYNVDIGLKMYADDHQIYETGKEIKTVLSAVQHSATTATNWYDSNYLQGNLKKYQAMIIRNQCTKTEKTCIIVKNKSIAETDSLMLLGIAVDCKLNFNEHISNVCRKASQRIGVIMRLRNLIPTEAKLQLYKSAILPHLTYCHLVWHFCRASDTRKLERVQERGMRAIFRDKQSSYNQLLERAKLPTLHNRRLQDICILMYKVKHNLCPRTVCNIFKTSNHSYSLRQTDFYLPNFNTVTYGKHSLRYLGPKLWSKLSSSERSSTSLYNFKLQIRKRDFNNILEGCNSCHLCNS